MGGKLINLVDVSAHEVSDFLGQRNELFFFLVMEKMQPVVVLPFYFCKKHLVHDVAWMEGRIFLRAKYHEDTVIFLLLKCALLVQKLACLARHLRIILA
jgi:hypothetical protein